MLSNICTIRNFFPNSCKRLEEIWEVWKGYRGKFCLKNANLGDAERNLIFFRGSLESKFDIFQNYYLQVEHLFVIYEIVE